MAEPRLIVYCDGITQDVLLIVLASRGVEIMCAMICVELHFVYHQCGTSDLIVRNNGFQLLLVNLEFLSMVRQFSYDFMNEVLFEIEFPEFMHYPYMSSAMTHF
uniref:Uncharacterized protein n=1 Tax=Cacopsylla melanoneura TaxID=428564 RepID=A0A8D8X8A2_9HEMI